MAAGRLAESLRTRRVVGDAWGMAYALVGFAALASQATPGEPARAARPIGAAVAAFASLGSDLAPPFRRVLDARCNGGHPHV